MRRAVNISHLADSTLAIVSFTIATLFVFGSVSTAWARAPRTAKIAYTSIQNDNAEIYVMNPDGSDQVNLTRNEATDFDPAWSPNGEEILFVSDRDGIPDLYLMRADGSRVRKVFGNPEFRADPVWSPDGRKIVYVQGEKEGDATIYVSTINGGSTQKLTKGFTPSWSPDGREIVFSAVSDKDSPLGIYNLQTRTKKNLLSDKIPWTIFPTWSPRGNKIAFSKIDGRFNHGILEWTKANIYIVNRDGTGLRQITKGEFTVAMGPTWSPHGDELIYTEFVVHLDQASTHLFKTDLSGRNPTQLTQKGDNFRADWFDPTALDVSPSEELLTTTWGKIKAD